MPLPFIGLAAVVGVRALVRSPRVRQAVARGISRARRARPFRSPRVGPGRSGQALATRAPGAALSRVVPTIRRAAPAVGTALALGGAFQVGASLVEGLIGGLSGPSRPQPASIPVPVGGGAPSPAFPKPSNGRAPRPLHPAHPEIRRPMPGRNGAPFQVQPVRGDVPVEFAEITVVKSWQTFPGGPVFTQFSNGKIAVRKKNGTLKVYRPARNIVISRNPRVRTLLRADSRLDSLMSRLRKAVTKGTPRSYSKRKGGASATARASTR